MLLVSVGGWIAIGVIAILVVALVALVINVYNKMVKGRNRCKDAFSQIDVQLTRRFDLIPNLVETVKGYTKHESSILEEFAKARNVYSQASESGNVAKAAEANNMLTSTISKLIAVSEAYPELKANTHYSEMMEELSNTEDKIAYTRQFYNDVVKTYNDLREVFPNSLVANMCGFKEAELFKADEASRQNVKVQF